MLAYGYDKQQIFFTNNGGCGATWEGSVNDGIARAAADQDAQQRACRVL
jgi:hypothetical protein